MSAPAPASESPRRGFRLPPTLVLLTMILLVAAIAAEIVPPGAFQRAEKVINATGTETVTHVVAEGETREDLLELYGKRLPEGEALPPLAAPGTEMTLRLQATRTRTVVVPGSYEPVERAEGEGVGARAMNAVAAVVRAPIRGFQDKAEVIAFILIIGGSFGLILGTGAVDAGLRAAVGALGDSSMRWVVIPVTMFLFSLGGAVFGMSEEVIPFVMITIPLALRLGWDSMTGVCLCFLGAGLGFAGAFLNPFTVALAQGIAEVPIYSGMAFRVGVWVLVTLIGVGWTMRWAMKVQRQPELSPTFASDRELIHRFESEEHAARFGARDGLVLATLAGAIALLVWGVTKHGWYMVELSGVFLGAGIVAAAIGGLGLHKASDAFLRGVADLSGAALIVAFSSGIVRVLEDASVLDTVLNAIASSVDGAHNVVAAWLMFLFQTLLNVLVPSGSGQAAMTMPIMAPLADLVGVSRQTAVLAYQFGDGFGNMIIPTSAVTMSVLGIARIPWETWAKWLWPLEAILFAFGMAALAVAVMIGY
mgnify:CR=1 FL=1